MHASRETGDPQMFLLLPIRHSHKWLHDKTCIKRNQSDGVKEKKKKSSFIQKILKYLYMDRERIIK